MKYYLVGFDENTDEEFDKIEVESFDEAHNLALKLLKEKGNFDPYWIEDEDEEIIDQFLH
jgi:hypothetical protein